MKKYDKKKLKAELNKAEADRISSAARALNLREAYDNLVNLPEMKMLIGKMFKFPRNCFSSPQNERDYWDVYARVTGMEDGCLSVIQFQTDSYGEFSYKKTTWLDGVSSGFVPCGEAEYVREFKKQTASVVL